MNPEELNNAVLIEALNQFRDDQNQANEQAFVAALKEAVFLAPVNFSQPPVINDDGSMALNEGTETRLIALQTEDGHSVFPIFTDMDALAEGEMQSDEDVYTWPMHVVDYAPIMESAGEELEGLAMNPFSDGMPISRENLQYLLNDQVHSPVPGGQTAAQGSEDAELDMQDTDDKTLPTPLMAELVGIADDSYGEIQTIHLLWLTNNKTKVANYLLILDGEHPEKIKALFPEFARAFGNFAPEGQSAVDMILKSELGVDLTNFRPKYTRNL
ncbi:SseB family protein [Weissella muntiaci]|nr:SseB family protein [Weissella muntiaci]